MDYELDQGIAVERLAPGEYAADLGAGWVVGGGVNGGYVLTVLGRAVSVELAPSGHPDPVSLSTYFLSASRPGPAVVRVRTLRSSRRRTTVAASLVQHEDGVEVERLTVLGLFGSLADDEPDVERQLAAPELPPVGDCVPSRLPPGQLADAPPLLERFGTRLDPAYAGWIRGEASGNGVVQAWFKLADDRPLDPLALLLVVDALPPATFDLGRPGWAPTLELTVYVRGVPAPGWAVVRHRTRTVAGGRFEEDCEVWDSTGRLVAQSRQLALLPR